MTKNAALRRVGRSTEKARDALSNRDAEICAALDLASVREVARAAGLSPARIHQIRHGR